MKVSASRFPRCLVFPLSCLHSHSNPSRCANSPCSSSQRTGL